MTLVERLRSAHDRATQEQALYSGWGVLQEAAKEIKWLHDELSWVYCKLRDGNNTHVDSDDVQSAVAADAAKGASDGEAM
jgi:hypothetical protein